jgi:Domain of unknown function (DUF3472)/Secretion system C-terminal sorting domain
MIETMKQLTILFFLLGALNVYGQENAAPSMHLTYYFPSGDAVLKMQKIKIVQSANASYFEVNWFTGGYAGLQQTPDASFGTPNILISSLWDANTAAGILSNVEYVDTRTLSSRFGGEGNGSKTINPYVWKRDNWYNLVNRAWKSGDRIHIGTFINDLSTGKWLHSTTLSLPFTGKYLTGTNDAFLENWDGRNAAWNGSFVRKAFFKDCWNINTNQTWEKNTRAFCNVNNSAADVTRNGIYHNSFNGAFDAVENAYMMQHGGTTQPSAAFNGTRSLDLPAQTNQGTSPVLTLPIISSVSATHIGGSTAVNWVVDDTKSPQLSAKIEILDSLGVVKHSFQDTLPQKRKYSTTTLLSRGNYTVRVTIRDIFNQLSAPVTANFSVQTGTSIREISANEPLIYPNPSSSLLYFNEKLYKAKMSLSNLNGQVFIHNQTIENPINIADLPNGMYIVKMVDETGTLMQRFMKQ